MKNWFNAAFYQRTAEQLSGLEPRFDAERFLGHVLPGLAERELLARLHRTAEAFHLALPITFPEQLAVLRAHAPQIGHNFTAIWPCAHVAARGLEHPDMALGALHDLTEFGSAEFALRPFLIRDQGGVLAVLAEWVRSPNEHVRRLASEGSRPRLPWGEKLGAFVADPSPTLPLLDALRADPSLYVRKSVANHLNDITKDHPELVLDFVAGWDRADPRTAWIVRHALRTLIKRGHPRALALFGAGEKPRLTAGFTAAPARLRLGEKLTLSATLVSEARRPQDLIVDYVVHYPRASGRASAKVFKWKTLTLRPGESITLTKRQLIRDFSTRRHHPGRHELELQINGRIVARTHFRLRTSG